jgi:hypothetical protein
MENKKFWLGMVFVFGFIAVGYLDAQADSRLNGTWIDEDGNETTFNNGNFQVFVPSINSYSGRGTYKTSNGNITQIITHIHGDGLNYIFEELILAEFIPPNTFSFSKKWYSEEEIQTELRRHGYTELLDFNLMFFSESAVSYNVAGNLLVMTSDGVRVTARRK